MAAEDDRAGAGRGGAVGWRGRVPRFRNDKMDLNFETGIAGSYTSGLQRARVLTEPWVASQGYCPNCGHSPLLRYPNNSPIGDFCCTVCLENYELKSKQGEFSTKVDDGDYRTMLRRLTGNANPNFFLLNYDASSLAVTSLVVIPKHLFTAEMIEERRPLGPTARRKGWIGCRILLRAIPPSGRIIIIRNGMIVPKAKVLNKWQRTLFLRKQRNLEAKGWLLHVMRCIERIGKRQFSLEEVYRFEDELSTAYPGNRNVRPKIRQKLQVLRENGYLEFVERGIYRLTSAMG